ncbi:Veg family protein [Filifactor villosus]|uniref:Veg family protein n=1 Tax=Filifactor villosus TaxID=29374 RepID=A0ABV9QPZ6_9FIRM|nr:Veg family protein [Filifactor alocis]
MASKHTLDDIKRGLEKHLGKDIVVRANKGRKKIVTREGVLECTYPSVFVVAYSDGDDRITRVSYSYADVLTSNVQLTLVRNEMKYA